MTSDDDDDEMQKIQRVSDFYLTFFFKPRVIESADGNPAVKDGYIYIYININKYIYK
jgi:hypothetical protein